MPRWDVPTKEYKEFETREVPPEGVIPARVCAFIDIGTHDQRDMAGVIKPRRCLWLGYELSELDSRNIPFYMSEIITLSMSTSSTLYKYVRALHGESEIDELLDPDWVANKPCMVQVSHDIKTKKGKERIYANIEGIMGCPKGVVTPPGSCIVWRVQDRHQIMLPNLGHLPAIWCEMTGQMLTVAEWVNRSEEVYGSSQSTSFRNKPTEDKEINLAQQYLRQSKSSRTQPMTQQEAEDIPF